MSDLREDRPRQERSIPQAQGLVADRRPGASDLPQERGAGRLRDLTYAGLADRYGVELCTGGCGDRGHSAGFLRGGRVHFRDRRVTRSGLRLFLMLVHDARIWRPLTHSDRPPPRRKATSRVRWLHHRNVWASGVALRDLGVRLPRKLSAADRAAVRYLLTKVPPEDDWFVPPRIHRWAR